MRIMETRAGRHTLQRVNNMSYKYDQYQASFDKFQSSKAGKAWNQSQDELAASEFGYESVAAMKEANAKLDEQYMTISPEEQAMLDEMDIEG